MGLDQSSGLYWSYCRFGNFGDWIAPLLFREIAGRDPVFFRQDCLQVGSDFFVTIGSILHHIRLSDRAIVWGSGIIARNCTFVRPRTVCALRGPLSMAAVVLILVAVYMVYFRPF